MGFLAEDPLPGERLAEAAGAPRLGLELDADPESAPAHLLDVRRVDRAQPLEGVGAELRRVLDHPLVDQDLQRLTRHGRAQRVAAECGAMVAGMEDAHHRVVGEHARDRIEAAREGLADDHRVRTDPRVLVGEQLSGAPEPGLDLVDHQQRPVPRGDLAQPRQVVGRRDDDAALALDRLDQHGDGALAHRLGDRVGVAVGQHAESPGEWTEARAVLIFRRESDDGGRAAVEIVGEDEDLALPVGHAAHRLPPLAGHLDGRLDPLGAAVHGQETVVAGEAADLLAETAQLVVAEGARAEGETRRLLGYDLDELRMAVALVDRRIGGEEVEVALAFDVPDPGTFAARDHDVERVVVVGAVAVLEGDQVRGAERRSHGQSVGHFGGSKAGWRCGKILPRTTRMAAT